MYNRPLSGEERDEDEGGEERETQGAARSFGGPNKLGVGGSSVAPVGRRPWTTAAQPATATASR